MEKKELVFSGGPPGDSGAFLTMINEFIGFVRINFAPKNSKIDVVDAKLRLFRDRASHAISGLAPTNPK